MSGAVAPGTAELIDALYGFARTAIAFGEVHPSTAAAARKLLVAIAEARPPVTLQFVEGCSFRDKHLVPCSATTFLRGAELGRWLRRSGADELAFEASCSEGSLGRLARTFTLAARGEPDPIADERVEGLRARRIPQAIRGEEAEDVTADVFAAAQLGLAIEGARKLVQVPEWPWRTALGVLRRLDRALSLHPRAVARVLELADIGSVTRRVVGVACLVRMALGAAGVSPVSCRVLTHVALALAAVGMEARGGRPFGDAVTRALPALLAEPLPGDGADPHRAQVIAVCAALEARRHAPAQSLLELAYELEVGRSPADVTFDLTTLDRLADLLREGGSEARIGWLRIAVHVFGVVPPGARVRLADGRTGVVLDAGAPGDPFRPTVLVDGVSLKPDEPVRLLGGAT